jgi:hypothetical protein
MTLIAFVGPTLKHVDPAVAKLIDFRPPACCGDITIAVQSGPAVIGLIDGGFETIASVWHKELLYALSEGITVFGAASIGALRAVELERFGMIGIGEVFRLYREGLIEDDDEVAVQHGPPELGFVPITEAMVNIRATLTAAVDAGVLLTKEGDALCDVAKALFYKRRTWRRILTRGASVVADRAVKDFSQWRLENSVDVKQRDAEQLLDAMVSYRPAHLTRSVLPVLARTKFWVLHEERFKRYRKRGTSINGTRDL